MVKHLFPKTATALAAAAFLFVLPQSCVNEEYSLDKEIDLTVSFGGESLVFPLGSTARLTLDSLLTDDDFEYIKKLNDGVLAFSMAAEEPVELSDDINGLTADLTIDPISLDVDPVRTDINIDLSSMKIDEIVFPEGDEGNITFDGMAVPDIDGYLPKEPMGETVDMGLSEYLPTDEQLTLDFGTYDPLSYGIDNNISDIKRFADGLEYGDDEPFGIPSQMMPSSLAIGNTAAGIELKVDIELSDNISNIRDIVFAGDAKMVVSATLHNSFLSDGTITPDIKITGLDRLFKMQNQADYTDGMIDLGKDLIMEADGRQTVSASHEYAISGLADGMNWDGNKLLETFAIGAGEGGKIVFENIYTTKNLISGVQDDFVLEVSIAFENMKIDDMTMDVAGISDEQTVSVPVDIDAIQLPEQVTGIGAVTMADGSAFDLEISSTDLDGISGLSADIVSLTVGFPEMMRFGAPSPALGNGESFDSGTNTLSIAGIDLASGRSISLPVEAIVPGEPDSGNSIDLSGTVEVKASFTAEGKSLSLKSLSGKDPKIAFSVTPTLYVEDYEVEVKPEALTHTVEIDEPVRVELPDGIEDVGTVTITPKTDKTVRVEVSKPALQNLDIKGQGLKISFPDMIVFDRTKGNISDYDFDPEGNTLTIDGEIPDELVLYIECITVGPDNKDEHGNYVAEGNVSVTGNAVAESSDGNILHKADIEALTDPETGGIRVSGTVEAIDVNDCTVSLDQYEFQIDEHPEIKLFDTAKFPEDIDYLHIDRVELADTWLTLDIRAASMPDLGSAPRIDVVVALPEEIIIDDSRVDDGNNLHIEGSFDSDNIFSMDPIAITGLDLNGYEDLKQAGEIMKTIDITGKVFVSEPKVENPEDLNGQEVLVYVEGGIQAVNIGKITGNIGYSLKKENEDGSDALSQTVDLSGLPDFIKGEDVTLDFANPYITVDVTSNIGIPVQGNISITPVFADVPDTENSQSIQITVPKKESAQDKGVTSYWIAASDTGMPQGYRFVKAEIGELLKEIPDSIELNIDASTDRAETFIVEPQAEYELALDYDVIVPLEFGEDLKIVMDYTFPGDGDLDENDGQTDGTETGSDSEGETLPSIMGELLNMNSLGIAGSIESTLPLELALRLELLDSEKKVIPSEAMQIPIQAGSMTHPSVSDLDVALKLAEGADGTDLSYIKMYFEVTSGNMAGEPVTEDSYIKATLKVKVPGGVTIDLRELGESEENKDGDTEGSAN